MVNLDCHWYLQLSQSRLGFRNLQTERNEEKCRLKEKKAEQAGELVQYEAEMGKRKIDMEMQKEKIARDDLKLS